MKTKQQLMEALAAKGVEFDPKANKAELEALAVDNGIPLEVEKEEGATEDRPHDDAELIAGKVAAGLSYEGAVEVIKRQREEDAKAKA